MSSAWKETQKKVEDPNYGINPNYLRHVNKLVDIQRGNVAKYLPQVVYEKDPNPRASLYNNRWLSAGITNQLRNQVNAQQAVIDDQTLNILASEELLANAEAELDLQKQVHDEYVNKGAAAAQTFREAKDKAHADELAQTQQRLVAVENTAKLLQTEKQIADAVAKNTGKKNQLVVLTPKAGSGRTSAWLGKSFKDIAEAKAADGKNLFTIINPKTKQPYTEKHVKTIMKKGTLPQHEVNIIDANHARDFLENMKIYAINK